jgi:hypothetical protein
MDLGFGPLPAPEARSLLPPRFVNRFRKNFGGAIIELEYQSDFARRLDRESIAAGRASSAACG